MARRIASPPMTIQLPALNFAYRKSTSEAIFETLREAILSLALVGGTPLIENTLAEHFGVSKTPVREALQRLTHTGLVDYEMIRGATVHTLTLQEVNDLCDLRVLIEPMALHQSAPRLTYDDKIALRGVLRDAEQAHREEDFLALVKLNAAFHGGLYKRATNSLLLQWIESLSDRRRLITMYGWESENRSQRELNEHRGIFEAVEQGDIEDAETLLRDHIARFSQLVMAHFTALEPEPQA
jgi:DNA-binding GntR family transcriptional regulator